MTCDFQCHFRRSCDTKRKKKKRLQKSTVFELRFVKVDQEMAGICRLCASFKTIDLLVPLFDSSHSIPAKVEQCCGTSLADDSDMPQTVCTGCLDVLNRNFTFAKAVTAAQSTLRKALTSRAMSISAALNSTVPANGGTVRWDTREVGIVRRFTLRIEKLTVRPSSSQLE